MTVPFRFHSILTLPTLKAPILVVEYPAGNPDLPQGLLWFENDDFISGFPDAGPVYGSILTHYGDRWPRATIEEVIEEALEWAEKA